MAFFYGKEKSAAFELESKDGLYEWFTYDKAAVGESGKGKVTRIDYEDAQNWVLEVEWDATKDAPAGFAQGVMMGRYFTWTEGQLRGGRKVVTGFSVNRRRS